MPPNPIADLQRLNFLQSLTGSGLPLSVWERQFLASLRHSSRPSLWFTHRRRDVTDRLRRKYGGELGPTCPPRN